MELERLARALKLGSDVAEQDSQLSRYFVQHAAYFEVIDDEADVILGPKGSGKSAISRRLVDAHIAIPQLEDVDVVPAFNLQGSSIFRRLAAEVGEVNEATMRTAWTIYVIALIGNHLVDNYWNASVRDLSITLDRLGLRYETGKPKSVWSSVLNTIKKIRVSSVEASLTVTETGIPVGSGSINFDATAPSGEPIDWEEILLQEIGVLTELGRRCWVVFDRLDEAFPHDRELERIALRALLHTHRDVCSYGDRIKSKLFLRTDLLDRVTDGVGFVNATHLRSHRITWDRQSITDFVARRLLGNAELSAYFKITEANFSTPQGCREVFDVLIPQDLGGNLDTPGWLINYTSDASREPNPRNILTLLRESRSRQLQICQREHPTFEQVGSILSKQAIRAGQRALSRIRLEDTLYAEFNELKPWIEAMEGRPFTYTPQQFANTMGYADPSELVEIIEDLKYAGVFKQAPNGQLTVPLLYRAGLNLQDRGDGTSTKNRRYGGKNHGSGSG